jgi:hypothetical protein
MRVVSRVSTGAGDELTHAVSMIAVINGNRR